MAIHMTHMILVRYTVYFLLAFEVPYLNLVSHSLFISIAFENMRYKAAQENARRLPSIGKRNNSTWHCQYVPSNWQRVDHRHTEAETSLQEI